jgi:hypothetical protein
MRQYPIGTAEHADRFDRWFNDFCAVLESDAEVQPKVTFIEKLGQA